MKKRPVKGLEQEIDFIAGNIDKIHAGQAAERQAFLSDPANSGAVSQAKLSIMLAETLYKARKSCNLTQAQLADKLNTKQAYIAKLEKGAANITIATLERIAAACGKHVSIQLR
jgi:ribosome-binding protein aMBF1 (putative translation factor)